MCSITELKTAEQLTLQGNTLCEWIACKSSRTDAVWSVTNNMTLCICTAGSWTRVPTL